MNINCIQGNERLNSDHRLSVYLTSTYKPALSLGVMPQFLIIIDKVLTRLSFAFCHFWTYTNIQTQERERDILSLDAN